MKKPKRPRVKHYKLRDLAPEIKELQASGSMNLRDYNGLNRQIQKDNK